jgi:CRISPR-associated protein Cas1
MQLLNTLYVALPDAYLRLDNDTLRIEVEQETRLRVPPHRLADEGIALVLLDDHGRFKARRAGAVSGDIGRWPSGSR